MGRKLDGFTNAAMDALCAHAWSGNVRELENEIERCVALAGDADVVGVEMLSDDVRGRDARAEMPPGLPTHLPLADAVDGLKRDMIRAALAETGNKTRAAQKLGVPRQSLQKMMKRLEITDDD